MAWCDVVEPRTLRECRIALGQSQATEEDETVQVLRRRLFASIDETSIPAVTDAYRALWGTHRESLADDAARPGTLETFRSSYPLHPEVLETLTGKTATLGNF